MLTHYVLTTVMAGGGIPVPDPAPAAPAGLEAFATTIISWLKWGARIGGMIGLLISAIMIIIGRRNRNQLATEGVFGAAWVFGGLSLVATAASLIGAFN